MKFDITKQPVFTTLVITLVMSVIGLFGLLHIQPSALDLVASPSLLGGMVTAFQLSQPRLSAVIAAVMVFWSAMWFGRIIAVTNIYSLNTTVQLQLLTILMWSSILCQDFLLASIITSLAAFAMGSMLLSVRNIEPSHAFNAVLILSILPTLYTPSIVFWLFIPIVQIVKGLTLRELIVSIVGLLLPFAGVLYIFWLCGYDFVATLESVYSMALIESHLFELDAIPLFPAIIFAISLLLMLFSLIWANVTIHKTQIRIRISLLALLAASLTLFLPSANGLSAAFLAPTLGLFAAFGMAHLRLYGANILYLVYLLLLVASMVNPIDLPL